MPYEKSEALRKRALKIFPTGAQIFNKTSDHLPLGVSPFFADKAKGSKLWDVDGNVYIDFINTTAAINLGHCDEEVTAAVQLQLTKGSIFSLSHPIELQVAEQIIEMVPCAQGVRFGKNGSDATTASIRLARAFTKRDRVAVAGYHGWHDWYIGTTGYNQGVPKAVSQLTHRFQYNNIDSLQQLFRYYPNEFAAVILEPFSGNGPRDMFLEKVKALSKQHGAVLIFDEIVSGFRYALGGAQEYCGVIPDLAVLGKGVANGYPLSAVVGNEQIMSHMKEVFVEATFSGETLSLAAAQATLSKLKNNDVTKVLAKQGKKAIAGIRQLINQYQLTSLIKIVGHSSHFHLVITAEKKHMAGQVRAFLAQELFANGILCLGMHNMSYAHTDEDISRLLTVYEAIFIKLRRALHDMSLASHLKCQPLAPKTVIRGKQHILGSIT